MADPARDAVPPIRLEVENEWAWCGTRRLELAPRQFALLRHLVERAGRLVTKDDILTVVWGGMVVSEAALTSCVRDLRRALGDSSQAPRYIATVHRRGFRFVGPVVGATPAAAASAAPANAALPLAGTPPAAPFVGRDAELMRLRELFAAAAAGRRRIAFVTGEAGIGKTALVDAFLAELPNDRTVRVARGQCVEHYGVGEAYLPVLEAFGRLGRGPHGPELVAILRQYAPTWLVQLPGLLDDAALDAVQRRAFGATRERMLREVSEALEALGAEIPFVLVLEDLHWADAATIELLAMLARRPEPARLLIVGTHRPADAAAAGHPLDAVARELHTHGQCDEVPLALLGHAAVAEYLAQRFPRATFPPAFAQRLHENTGGNALFLVNVIGDLLAQGRIVSSDDGWDIVGPIERAVAEVPRTLWQMVEKQLERLTAEEHAVLAVGSVAGAEFSAALATVDGIALHDAERACDGLARRGHILRVAGVAEWPDGTVAGRYAFVHALYRNVVYARIAISHRVGLHLRIGARLDAAHGTHADGVAGELAMHFEHGRDLDRAIHYRHIAADAALRRHAHAETLEHAARALAVLATMPAAPERDLRELPLQTMRAAALIATSGWAAPAVEPAYTRARELCGRLGLTPQLFPVLLGLWGFSLMRGDLAGARDLCGQILEVADAVPIPIVALAAHNTAGLVAFYGGDFVAARGHFERAMSIYDPAEHNPNALRAFNVDHDPGISCLAHAAWTHAALGQPDRAAALMTECLRQAHAIDHPVSLIMACNFAAPFYKDRGECDRLEAIERMRQDLATTHGLDLFLGLGTIYRGWLYGDVDLVRGALEAFRRTGALLGAPTFCGILAEVCGTRGRSAEGLAAVDEGLAIAQRTGFHYVDAELRRVEGELRLAAGDPTAAARCFDDALSIARRQQARTYELRAAMALARLWQEQGRTAPARELLAAAVAGFTEGFETRDLVNANALLVTLDGGDRPRRSRARPQPQQR